MTFSIYAEGVADLKRKLVDLSFLQTSLEVEKEVEQMKEDRLEYDHFFHTHFADGCELCWKEREQCADDLY